MAAGKAPVAIRITRPYATEEEFLAAELDTISRTGVTLVGAQQRPDGAVLRFELALASGAPLLRGEGRVVGYREGAHGGEPGLSLRFTRLDSKSKSLVDRVAVLREARRSSAPPAPPSSASATESTARPSTRPKGVPPPLPPGARKSAIPPPLAPPASEPPPPPPPPAPSSDGIPVSVPDMLLTTSDLVVASPAVVAEAASASVSASPNREAILARLRSRRVDPDQVDRILSEGASRRR